MGDDVALFWNLFHGQFPGESMSSSVYIYMFCNSVVRVTLCTNIRTPNGAYAVRYCGSFAFTHVATFALCIYMYVYVHYTYADKC